MKNTGTSYNTLISIAIGLFTILTGCLIAYFFQKHLFSKYKNKVKNTITINKDNKPTS